MPTEKSLNVTMRVRVGDNELEVTGPKDYVEDKIKMFLSEIKKTTMPAGPGAEGLLSKGALSDRQKGMSPAQFFKKVGPRTDVDRVLAAGYYLETFQKMDKFTAAEIRETIRKEAKTQPPKNPNDSINANIRKGHMMSAGDKDAKIAFVLTSDGEEAVKALLEE